MSFRCIGCDHQIPWDGKGLFFYTCACRSAIFYNEESRQVSLPASVAIGISLGSSVPHLDDLVGSSSYTSPAKEELIAKLKVMGFIWMRECEQCQKDGTLKKRQEREAYWTAFEIEHHLGQKGS